MDDLPDAAHSATHLPDRPSSFPTEQFILQSARSSTVAESGTHASIYLTTLSSALVAFGFLANTPYAAVFLAAILPVVVVLGVFTYVRLVHTSLEDVAALAALQQIRRYYRTRLPGADRYFPMPTGPHAPNEMLDIGNRASWRGVFFTLSSAIGTVNSIVAGIGVTATLLPTEATAGSAIAGIAIALTLTTLHGLYQERRYAQLPDVIRASRHIPGDTPSVEARRWVRLRLPWTPRNGRSGSRLDCPCGPALG